MKKRAALGDRRGESGDELGPDLVGGLRDAGPERGAITRERRRPSAAIAATVASTTPSQRAFPARMRRADDARLGVGEQDHAAIGAGDAERQPRRRGDEPVAARARIGGPGRRDRRDIGRMDLIGHEQPVRARRRAPPPCARGSRRPRSGASREPTPPFSEA